MVIRLPVLFFFEGFVGASLDELAEGAGCDPGDDSTDHTREYIPLLLYGDGIAPRPFGIRPTFADVAATVADALGVDYACPGTSLLKGDEP